MLIDQQMTGCLAPMSEAPAPKPIPVTKPSDVSDAHWAVISADTAFMTGLAPQPIFLRFEKIAEYVARIDRAERSRASIAAYNTEQEREREARKAAEIAHPTDAMRIASLEAALIELRVRVAGLEEALAKSKPAKVSRIARPSPTSPEAA
jgi:hypothetical protein